MGGETRTTHIDADSNLGADFALSDEVGMREIRTERG
jgi:hypothetical protein